MAGPVVICPRLHVLGNHHLHVTAGTLHFMFPSPCYVTGPLGGGAHAAGGQGLCRRRDRGVRPPPTLMDLTHLHSFGLFLHDTVRGLVSMLRTAKSLLTPDSGGRRCVPFYVHTPCDMGLVISQG